MSDASHPHCRKCRQPDYACDCDEPDYIEPVISLLMRGKRLSVDHPFYDRFKKPDRPVPKK